MTTSKSLIRQKALNQRQALTYDQAVYAAHFRTAFEMHFKYTDLGVLAFYWPLDSEADPRDLAQHYIKHHEGQTCLPVVIEGQRPLVFKRWQAHANLQKGAVGIMVPADEEPLVIPDTLIVPLVGFNAQGDRVGFGKGHYDATLRQLRAHKEVKVIGFAYDEQFIDESWEIDLYDEKLDYVLTPHKLYDVIG